MAVIEHLTRNALDAGLDEIRRAPKETGTLDLIVRRPDVDQREVLAAGRLDLAEGLEGDTWKTRGSTRTADGAAHPEMQLNIMNSRAIDLIAQSKDRWPLAGDQLFVDFDLSEENVPPGTRLEIGAAVIEVTAEPHTGCAKFIERFGLDAMKWVNSPVGRELHLRGINAKVVQSGAIGVGDAVQKVAPGS